MFQAFLLSFGVIFVAELGDKSQLMALAFATRYRPVPILIGITIATALVHAVSVFVGAVIGARIPTHADHIVAGLAFLGFAAWTLRGDELDEDEAAKVGPRQPLGDRGRQRGVLPGRAGRQDDAGHDHPGHHARARSGCGSARPSAWSPPTRWPS